MIINDCIHGEIEITDSLFQNLISTKAVQRLKNIKQQGHTYLLNKHAIQNRFEHTIGVFYLTSKILDVKDITGFEKRVALVTALMHDVGHGPYSHTFEAVTNIHHEIWSELFIKKDAEISNILKSEEGLYESVLNVLKRNGSMPHIEQILFSELGADKLDYIQRDYFYNFNEKPLDNRILQIVANTHYASEHIIITDNMLKLIIHLYEMKERLFLNSFGHTFVLGLDLMLKILLHHSESNELFNISHSNDELSRLEAYKLLDDDYIYELIKHLKYEDPNLQNIQELYLGNQSLPFEIDKQHFNTLIKRASFSEIIQRPLKYGGYSKGIIVKTNDDINDLRNYISSKKYESEILYFI